MLNWIKFISVFLIALTSIIVITIFYNANKPSAAAINLAKEAAIASGQIVTVNSVQSYNGADPLMTVFGLNKAGEEIALFVNNEMDGKYESVKLADGITAEEAITVVREELQIEDVLHVTLGFEEKEPVWEVVFTSKDDKLNYVYVFFENGQWWKRILNL